MEGPAAGRQATRADGIRELTVSGGDPKPAVGDGALGFGKALGRVFPATRVRRCWVHKMVNVPDRLPKPLHGEAKDKPHPIWMAPGRKEAHAAFDRFVATYQAKSPQAVECPPKDRDVWPTPYNFPAEHWMHLRTTNPIEGTFAPMRPRTDKTNRRGSRLATLTMVDPLAESASKKWRRLNGHERIQNVITDVQFTDAVKQHAA